MATVKRNTNTAAALGLETERLREVSEQPDRAYIWFWQAPQSLVVPRNLAVKPEFETASARLSRSGWPVEVRATGGDVTPMGEGIVCVSIVYAREPGGPVDIAAEYDKLCTPMEATLGPGATRGWQPGAFCDGEYNVQWQGLKFAGTAMRFRPCKADKTRYAILAHALMLFQPPSAATIAAINAFLTAMGEPRVIDPAAHTGLPETTSETRFLQDLEDAYRTHYRI